MSVCYVFLAQCAAVFLCESTHDFPSGYSTAGAQC